MQQKNLSLIVNISICQPADKWNWSSIVLYSRVCRELYQLHSQSMGLSERNQRVLSQDFNQACAQEMKKANGVYICCVPSQDDLWNNSNSSILCSQEHPLSPSETFWTSMDAALNLHLEQESSQSLNSFCDIQSPTPLYTWLWITWYGTNYWWSYSKQQNLGHRWTFKLRFKNYLYFFHSHILS